MSVLNQLLSRWEELRRQGTELTTDELCPEEATSCAPGGHMGKIPHEPPPPGRNPTPEELASIWETDYIPDDAKPATKGAIAEAEKRLGVKIPALFQKQLAVRNGGVLFFNEDNDPFQDRCPLWTNASIDGILPVEEWKAATDSNGFDSIKVPNLKLLVIIAGHSEAQLCLDFRSNGPKGMPSITFVDVCTAPATFITVAKTADDFVAGIIRSREDE